MFSADQSHHGTSTHRSNSSALDTDFFVGTGGGGGTGHDDAQKIGRGDLLLAELMCNRSAMTATRPSPVPPVARSAMTTGPAPSTPPPPQPAASRMLAPHPASVSPVPPPPPPPLVQVVAPPAGSPGLAAMTMTPATSPIPPPPVSSATARPTDVSHSSLAARRQALAASSGRQYATAPSLDMQLPKPISFPTSSSTQQQQPLLPLTNPIAASSSPGRAEDRIAEQLMKNFAQLTDRKRFWITFAAVMALVLVVSLGVFVFAVLHSTQKSVVEQLNAHARSIEHLANKTDSLLLEQHANGNPVSLSDFSPVDTSKKRAAPPPGGGNRYPAEDPLDREIASGGAPVASDPPIHGERWHVKSFSVSSNETQLVEEWGEVIFEKLLSYDLCCRLYPRSKNETLVCAANSATMATRLESAGNGTRLLLTIHWPSSSLPPTAGCVFRFLVGNA